MYLKPNRYVNLPCSAVMIAVHAVYINGINRDRAIRMVYICVSCQILRLYSVMFVRWKLT